MNNVLTNPIRQTLRRLDHLISLASIVVVPTLISVALIWYVERPPYQQLHVSNVLEVQTNQVVDLNVPIDLRLETKQAAYYLVLKDVHDTTVYVYPTHYVVKPCDFRVGDLKVQVPPTLKAGSYKLQLTYLYWFNPFKDGQVDMDLATLNVK